MSETMTSKIFTGAVTGVVALMAGLLWGGGQSESKYTEQAVQQNKVQEKILDKLTTIDKTSTTTQTDVKHLTNELNRLSGDLDKLSDKVETNSRHIFQLNSKSMNTSTSIYQAPKKE